METNSAWQRSSLEQLLAERFQITTGFYPGQRAIIEQLVQGRRILAIQRTGWGKSLCYQLTSICYPHLTIVFSPLKALMRDQCQRCNNLYHIPAAIVSSDFTDVQNEATLKRAVQGRFKLLYIAPERLQNPYWQSYVTHMRISMIVIDEAHCISVWGHDFRPEYRRIVNLLHTIPHNTPVLALTATANKRVEEDILQQMGANVQVIRGPMQRSNLYLHVVRVCGSGEKLGYIGEALLHCGGTGIIYTATRSDAETVAAFLQHQKVVAEYYHAGRDDSIRQEIEQNLMANRYKVVCSTNALGMGIDKRDVRFIIHYHIPASPIHYYQEMGRAGRDGQVAHCILLYDPEDIAVQQHFIQSAKPESRYYKEIVALLKSNAQGLHESDFMRLTGFPKGVVRTILADLLEQNIAERNSGDRSYTRGDNRSPIDFSSYDNVRMQKLQELEHMRTYAQHEGCFMEYLTAYLGDQTGHCCGVCGHCQPANFPLIRPTERIQKVVTDFLDDLRLPGIEKWGDSRDTAHEAGWSLSLHGATQFGKLVRASKYKDAGPFALQLVLRAVEVIRSRYPMDLINVIVHVPPTRSGLLVEGFAQQVAAVLGIDYLAALVKIRETREQRYFTNRLQKKENVQGAFQVCVPELVAGRTLLLIDDIYDSGETMSEVGRTLMRAGAQAVYPFTILLALHYE